MPILMEKTGREAKNSQLYRLISRRYAKISKTLPVLRAKQRFIGLDYKVRARTMRGFKNWPKALEHCYLSE